MHGEEFTCNTNRIFLEFNEWKLAVQPCGILMEFNE
jgi:hypothetical protein